MAMSMILDRTLSMRCPSVRQSSAIRWLVEIHSGDGTHNAAIRVMPFHARRETVRSGANCPSVSQSKRSPERPDQEMCAGMSEYPCTGIDKAILKFPLQDRKISQIVSVNVSAFFLNFVRHFLPFPVFFHQPERLYTGRSGVVRSFSYEAYATASAIILRSGRR
ncbi:hypothetical protein [Paraburkholderia xenovorans]|uniref:hypothetical protein n=1 Tax=Paraburkholderia xenovorans TaxID=36873 RepID=UPI001A06C3E7|nr:hypothetical protein [Paraburkholderia xenovorans]NPT34404.1 hypothetical protein [Paraburkholderia xenovorans]